MRRADRLVRLIETLRGRRNPVTARFLAESLEVSPRTVYRDVADLMASGVPIMGEAGVGYVLGPGYHVPPIMFDGEELEALALGASMVANWTDPALGEAARRLRAKVESVLPERLREHLRQSALMAAPSASRPPWSVDMEQVRAAIRDRRRLTIAYTDEQGRASTRTIRPLGLVFFGPVWLLVAWCEMREDFRSFRLDRIGEATTGDGAFPIQSGRRLEDFMKRVREGTR